jgi:four helix bundle protein
MLIAMGSASELEYHLLLAHGLGYLAKDFQKLSQQTREAKRMLSTFMNKLRHNKPTS